MKDARRKRPAQPSSPRRFRCATEETVMSNRGNAIPCYLAVLIGTALFYAQSAQAEYRCNPPPTQIDDTACKKAQEGPEALRWYIQRMRKSVFLRLRQ
jgi:hypothetical protein